MRLIDSHCHIDSHPYDRDRAEVVLRAREAGVEHMVIVGLWREKERVAAIDQAVTFATTDPGFLSATACIHPHDVSAVTEEEFQAVEAICARPEVRGVGETGLDYHYDHSPRDAQQEGFRRFIRLAHRVKKPLVVHTRAAEADTYRLLDEEGIPERGAVIHCFTGDRAAAREYVARGLYVSFSGISTFKTGEEIREAAKLVPLDRMLVETDSPYLAPLPNRGKRNEPAWVARVVEVLADVRGMSAEDLGSQTADNARRFFGLASM